MTTRKTVIRHPLADRETEDAAEHYEAESEDAARRFVIEVRRTTHRIQADPRLYPILHADIRRALLHRFPYAVIYRETLHEIQVIAVAHTSRRPGYWRERTF